MSEVATGRAFAEGDRDAALRLFDSNVPEFFHPSERADYVAWLDAPGGPVLVVERAGEVVAAGGVALEADGETGSLCWGIVRRDLHGQGLGRMLLMERLALLADDARCRRVRLSTIQATAGFFEKLGFRTVRVDPGVHGAGTDAWEMTLELTDQARQDLRRRG